MINTIIYMDKITRDTVRANPDTIFVFGDNDARVGLGGLAKETRGEPNAIGIRVKKAPSMENSAFYKDDEFNSNIVKISEDITLLSVKSEGKNIVFPKNGIGKGLAKLQEKAPKTLSYLNEELRKNFGIINGMP